jgi:hypothetical protein
MQSDSFADVGSKLIERQRLRDDRQIEAFGDVLFLATKDSYLNRSFHVGYSLHPSISPFRGERKPITSLLSVLHDTPRSTSYN